MNGIVKKKYGRLDHQKIYENAMEEGVMLVNVQINRNLNSALETLNEVPGLGEKTIEKVVLHLHKKIKEVTKKTYNRPDYQRIYEQGIVDGAMLGKAQANQSLLETLLSLNEVPGLGEKTIEKVIRHLHKKISKR